MVGGRPVPHAAATHFIGFQQIGGEIMAKCLICDAQKGKRLCTLKGGLVCSLCCGTTRTPEACGGCPYSQDPKRTSNFEQVSVATQGSGHAPKNALSSQNQAILLSDQPTGKLANSDPKQLIKTVTGEIYQPVRLYYKIFDKSAVENRFRALRCMDIDREHDRWVWLYIEEARKISFPYPYKQISNALHPVVIGSFFTKVDEEMYLDVRSIERAIEAILFFDKHIDRSFARVTHAAVLNYLPLDNPQAVRFNFDEFFCDGKMEEIKPDQFVDDLHRVALGADDINERRQKAFEFIRQNMSKKIPDAEKFPANFYEDGISPFEASLRLRQIAALERWQGKKDLTHKDVLEKLFGIAPF